MQALPAITSQPVGGATDVGVNFTFTVAGTLATSFQWRKDGTNIAGAAGTSLALINVQTTNSGSYTVVLSNSTGSVTSAPPAVLTVTQAATIQPVAINDANINPLTSGRTNLALASLGSTTFASSSLNGSFGPSLVNDGIYNDTANAWIAGTANNGEYVGVAFTNTGGVTLGALVFGGETGYDGRSTCTWSLQYTTNASPGTGTPDSSWKIIGDYTNWVSSLPMPRSYFSFPSISNVTGIRLVSIGNLNASQKCIQELQAYSPMPLPVSITTQPVGGTAAVGDNFTFTVTGTNMTGYQWQNGGTNIPGATTSSLTLVNVHSNDAAAYTVVLINLESGGSVTSSPSAVLTVTNAPIYASYQATILADSPIHYYPLNDASGTIAADLGSSNYGGGTYMGGCTLGQPGPATNGGNSVYFDGAAGTYVNLGLFHPGNEATVECWANLDADARGGFNSFVDRFDGSYELDFNGNNANWLAYNAAGSLVTVTAGSSAPRGNWHHLVGVYQTNGIQTIYLDGVATTSARTAGVLKSVAGSVIPDQVLIGATRDGTNASFNFKGYISDVTFYDHAVVPGHLLAHYNYNAAAVDANRPVLTTVSSVGGKTIQLVFNETVRGASAMNVVNFIVNGGTSTVTNAVLQSDFKTVVLSLATPIVGTFGVAASNVLDVAGNASLAANVVNGTVRFNTTVALSSSSQTNGFLSSVTLAAAVQTNGVTAGDAGGSVQFKTNGVSFGGPVGLTVGMASTNLATLPRGTNIIVVEYSGDANYLASTNILDQIVTNHPPVANNNSYTRNGLNSWKILVSDLLTNATDADNDTLALTCDASTNGVTILISGGYVQYSNPNIVDDQFGYTVTDIYGATSSAVITLTAGSSSGLGGQISGIAFTGGVATMSFAGIPGYQYHVQVSTNLSTWNDILITNAPAGGVFQFNDNAAPLPAAYYRLMWNGN